MTATRIRQLNDAFRYWVIRLTLAGRTAAAARFGKIVITSGVAALGIDPATILRLVMNSNRFGQENDPSDTHAVGTLEHESCRIVWKIDCYAPDLCRGSDDPADPKRTVRVLTVMRADDC